LAKLKSDQVKADSVVSTDSPDEPPQTGDSIDLR